MNAVTVSENLTFFSPVVRTVALLPAPLLVLLLVLLLLVPHCSGTLSLRGAASVSGGMFILTVRCTIISRAGTTDSVVLENMEGYTPLPPYSLLVERTGLTTPLSTTDLNADGTLTKLVVRRGFRIPIVSTLRDGLADRCELPKSETLRVDSSLTGLTDSVPGNSEVRPGCASSPMGNELPNSVRPGVLMCVSVLVRTLCFTARILLPYVLVPVMVTAGSVCLRTVVGSRLVVAVLVVVMCNIGNGGGANVDCSIGTGNGGTLLLNDVTSSAFVQLSLPSLSEHCEHDECEHTESKYTNTEPVLQSFQASKYLQYTYDRYYYLTD